MMWRWLTCVLVLGACGDGDGGNGADVPPDDTRDTLEDADTPDEPEDSNADSDAGPDSSDGEPADTAQPDGGWLARLESPEDLARLAADDGEVKYLAKVDGRTAPPAIVEDCYFQDMSRWQWHIDFLHAFPSLEDLPYSAYVAMVIQRPSRVLWGGAVRPYPAAIHPRTHLPGVVAYTVYGEGLPGSLTVSDLAEVDARLERCAPFAAELLVLVPADVGQQQLVATQREVLAAADVDALMPGELRPGLVAEAYVAGEGYGTLLVVPPGEVVRDYGPRDVVIATAAPNDISIVAGLVTKDPQNVHSHVNLRLAEKGIPSASVADIYDNQLVSAYAGKLVHLVVGDTGVVLEPATLEAAEAFWDAHRPTLPNPVADLDVTALRAFDALRASDAAAYGVKAANLGELHHLLAPEHRVEGFGIPLSAYASFIASSGIGADIEALLADPRMSSDAAYRSTRLEALREAIEDAPFPQVLLATIADTMRATLGAEVDTMRVKFRSSTNAEDLDAISGAGLYDSKSGCLADDLDGDSAGPSRCLSDAERAFKEAEVAARRAELAAHPERIWLTDIIDDFEGDLTKEKPVARAVKKVWASLWNERAFEERAYYGIDHAKVYMGIAVDPSFVLETANAVAVTNLAGGVYRLVSQTGWLSVVRPEDPLAVAEVLTFRRGPGDAVDDVQVLVPSTLVPSGETVWSAAELETLGGLLFAVHDHFAAEVYPDVTPLRLDLEIKRTHDGRIVLKQVRPYLGGG